MLDDLKLNLDILLKHGLIESNNRIDKYDDKIDVLRITPYGIYALSELMYTFAYLDLIVFDTNVYDESFANYIAVSGNDDLNLFLEYKKVDRVKQRIDKTEEFIKYLHTQEQKEIEIYPVVSHKIFTETILLKFYEEKKKVLASLGRQQIH